MVQSLEKRVETIENLLADMADVFQDFAANFDYINTRMPQIIEYINKLKRTERLDNK